LPLIDHAEHWQSAWNSYERQGKANRDTFYFKGIYMRVRCGADGTVEP